MVVEKAKSIVKNLFTTIDNQKVEKRYLEDQPVREHKADRFQFAQIADLMYQLLEQGHLPLHIGLLGPWGSGKTSVLRLLEKRIQLDGDKYDIKFISVWKFSEDAHSLQRKIVREAENSLELNKPEGISLEISHTNGVQGTNIGALFVPLNKLYKQNKLYYFAVVLFLLTVIISPVLSLFVTINSGFFLSLINIFLLAIFSVVTGLLNKSTIQHTNQTQVKELGLQFGDQYEYRFNSAVEEYLNKKKNKKLIFVFDDLDRLPPKQLVAALNTIKTFFRSDLCAFIIPCDEAVLRSGIKKVFEEKKMTNFSVSEYLNKTFDHLIQLPVLEQANMKKYAKQLLVDQNVHWTKDARLSVDRILGNLIHSDVKTPRQVKNILNAFAYDWALACKRDEEAGVVLLTKDPMAISVFTVLKTNYPNFFEKLKVTPFLIKEDFKEKTGTEKEINENPSNEDISDKSSTSSSDDDEDHLDEMLIAFLSRVKNSIPSDPRAFIYFTNEKLNPAAGKPDIDKAKAALMNDQPELFESFFNKLPEEDKPVVLESTLSDIEDNAFVEIENCLNVLIQSEFALKYIQEMDRIRWEHLVQQNLIFLAKFPISSVCYALQFIGPYSWKEYGQIIEVDQRYEEILEVWKNHPEYIEQLSISRLSTLIGKAFSSNNKDYFLLETVLSASEGHDILNELDWWNLMLETAEKKLEPMFNFKDWLMALSHKTAFDLTCSSIAGLYKAFSWKWESPLEGIGELWCDTFANSGNEKDLNEILDILESSTIGFKDADLQQIGIYLSENRSGEDLSQKVIGVLKSWWDFEESDGEEKGTYKETALDLIKNWRAAPGIPEFCLNAFVLSLEDKYINSFIEILINRPDEISDHEVLLAYLFGQVRNASGKSGASDIILKMGGSPVWKQKAKHHLEELVINSHITTILGWSSEALRDRVELFCKLKNCDSDALEWMENTIFTLIRMARGLETTPLGNPSVSLNIIVSCAVEQIQFTNWDHIFDRWNSVGMKEVLDAQNQEKVLRAFLRHSAVENESINQWFVESRKLEGRVYQDAILARWEYMSESNRTQILNNLVGLQDDNNLMEQYLNKLIQWYEANPFLEHIEELAAWPINETSKRSICRSIVQNVNNHTLGLWISEEIANMNQHGKQHWKRIVVEEATKLRHDLPLPDDITILETAIGIGDERAQLALQVIASAETNKGQIQRLRGKIQQLSDDFPEEVSEVNKKYNWSNKW